LHFSSEKRLPPYQRREDLQLRNLRDFDEKGDLTSGSETGLCQLSAEKKKKDLTPFLLIVERSHASEDRVRSGRAKRTFLPLEEGKAPCKKKKKTGSGGSAERRYTGGSRLSSSRPKKKKVGGGGERRKSDQSNNERQPIHQKLFGCREGRPAFLRRREGALLNSLPRNLQVKKDREELNREQREIRVQSEVLLSLKQDKILHHVHEGIVRNPDKQPTIEGGFPRSGRLFGPKNALLLPEKTARPGLATGGNRLVRTGGKVSKYAADRDVCASDARGE